MHEKHSLVINIPRQLLYGKQTRQLAGVWKSPGLGSSCMGNMQYAILFKQRPKAFPSMIYFPFMTKIILCVQWATFGSSKINQNTGFFNKKSFGGPRFFVPKRGAIDTGGHDSSFWLGGHWHGGGIGKGGGGGGTCAEQVFGHRF